MCDGIYLSNYLSIYASLVPTLFPPCSHSSVSVSVLCIKLVPTFPSVPSKNIVPGISLRPQWNHSHNGVMCSHGVIGVDHLPYEQSSASCAVFGVESYARRLLSIRRDYLSPSFADCSESISGLFARSAIPLSPQPGGGISSDDITGA